MARQINVSKRYPKIRGIRRRLEGNDNGLDRLTDDTEQWRSIREK